MRVATWNLEGKWSSDHERVLMDLECDVWLLTEVRPEATLPGYGQHLSSARMAPHKHWAGLLARQEMSPVQDLHPAPAGAQVAGRMFWCSVLPWPLSGGGDPWDGPDHASQMAAALKSIAPGLAGGKTVWGGDWNQPLRGNISGFSRAAQAHLLRTLDQHGLQVPTQDLPSRKSPQFSIDHIAVPADWAVTDTGRVEVPDRLSDHDAYWVEVSLTEV